MLPINTVITYAVLLIIQQNFLEAVYTVVQQAQILEPDSLDLKPSSAI